MEINLNGGLVFFACSSYAYDIIGAHTYQKIITDLAFGLRKALKSYYSHIAVIIPNN